MGPNAPPGAFQIGEVRTGQSARDHEGIGGLALDSAQNIKCRLA